MFRFKSRANSRVKFRVDYSDDSRAKLRVNSRFKSGGKFSVKLLGSSQWPSLGSTNSVKF